MSSLLSTGGSKLLHVQVYVQLRPLKWDA